jgi:hypothetical protein
MKREKEKWAACEEKELLYRTQAMVFCLTAAMDGQKQRAFARAFLYFFSEFSFVSFYACTEMLRESRMVYSVLEYDVCSCVLLTSVVRVRSRGDDGEKGRRQDRARRRAGRQQGGQS